MLVFRKLQKPEEGFTLLEIIVSLVIVAFLAGALYVTFSQGVRIWQAATRETKDTQLLFFFEELQTDLRHGLEEGAGNFSGDSHEVSFRALAKNSLESGSHIKKGPVRIHYQYDSRKREVRKKTFSYEEMLNHSKTAAVEGVVLSGAEDFKFQYYRHPLKGMSASWVEKWEETCLPEAVRITLTMEENSHQKITRVLALPASGMCRDEKLEGAV